MTFSMRAAGAVVGTAVGTVAVLTGSLTGSARARADDFPCGVPFERVIDGEAHTVQICPDWAPDGRIPVHATVRDIRVVGHIEAAGDDWYACGLKGRRHALGNGRVNDWWAKTMADNGAWGYVSQLYFRGGGNLEPDRGLLRCAPERPVSDPRRRRAP
ncbi:hypothetical protein [Nonomuraea jiangxiensis]|uniref:Uncharacterized protein n=1 Tax=Nonomuraea jiangxiensis TaxID=633440 RepID=A0A1G8D025_9ACTN|nr:hypothetical protein [Nonomuraea jiangxiensis]SDH51217.1 hypothetical protein SAMN05421869_102437 [Nonomuraea jiangxiensis]